MSQRYGNLANTILLGLISVGTSLIISNFLMKKLFPADGKDSKTLASQLRRPEIANLKFTPHEMIVAECIITNSEINVSFADIGGLHSELEDIEDNVIFPMKMWSSKAKKSTCPTGVLLCMLTCYTIH